MGLFDNFGDSVEFYENPEPRCPCVVVVDRKMHDTSRAGGDPCPGDFFYDVVTTDRLAALRTEIAIVTSTLGVFNVSGVKSGFGLRRGGRVPNTDISTVLLHLFPSAEGSTKRWTWLKTVSAFTRATALLISDP